MTVKTKKATTSKIKKTRKAGRGGKQKRKNPLYVVTQKGKVVEEAKGHIDALIKSMGLAPIISFLEEMFQILVSKVTSYSMFILLKEFIDDLVERLEKAINRLGNFLPFNL